MHISYVQEDEENLHKAQKWQKLRGTFHSENIASLRRVNENCVIFEPLILVETLLVAFMSMSNKYIQF